MASEGLHSFGNQPEGRPDPYRRSDRVEPVRCRRASDAELVDAVVVCQRFGGRSAVRRSPVAGQGGSGASVQVLPGRQLDGCAFLGFLANPDICFTNKPDVRMKYRIARQSITGQSS